MFLYARSSVANDVEKEPVPSLILNGGQLKNSSGRRADNVLLYAQTPDIQFFVTDNGMTFVFAKDVEAPNAGSDSAQQNAREMHRIDIDLVGANILL
ncbi:MAG TPA: hypothetical protein VEY71_10795, partial [Chitinophagales bacterium]|nr:hypothetical protein [Chitinophagales bacterium]